jgi:cytochrome c-type biogenesis protein CcmH
MSAFIAIGAVMVLAALTVLLWPLLRSAPAGRRWPAILMISIAIPLATVALYAKLGNWRWSQPPSENGAGSGVPPAIAQMVARLDARLQTNPNDVDGWLMLGRSYFQLNRFDKSADAYSHAYTLTQGRNVEAVLGLGEALAFADEHALSGRAGQLFEQGRQLAPHHPKALWYTGLAAYRSNQLEVARERWSELIALDPPPEIKRILTAKIAEIDEQLRNGSAPMSKTTKPRDGPG